MTPASGGRSAVITRADFLRGAFTTGVGLSLGVLPTPGRAAAMAETARGRPVVSAFIRGLLDMDMQTLAAFLDNAGFDGAEVPVRASLSYIRPDQAAEQLPRLAGGPHPSLSRRGFQEGQPH